MTVTMRIPATAFDAGKPLYEMRAKPQKARITVGFDKKENPFIPPHTYGFPVAYSGSNLSHKFPGALYLSTNNATIADNDDFGILLASAAYRTQFKSLIAKGAIVVIQDGVTLTATMLDDMVPTSGSAYSVEDLTDQVTGSATAFTLSTGYVELSPIFIKQGIVQNGSAGYLTETDPAAGVLTTSVAVPAGQSVIVIFQAD